MHIQALVTILTEAILIVELTFAHLAQIVLMEVVASIAFLAEAFEPMLADIVIVLSPKVVLMRWLTWRRVPVWTAAAKWTGSCRGVRFANRNSGGKGGEAMAAEEWCEAEIVYWYVRRLS